VVLQGLDDHIVVSTPDALLVVRKRDEQMIKKFVEGAEKEWGETYV
jgi:mannose-1-phosphate guanylyltransferase